MADYGGWLFGYGSARSMGNSRADVISISGT